MRRRRGHERPRLGEHREECVLAEEGRFARHVRAGDEPHAVALAEIAVVGDEGPAGGAHRRLDHRVPPGGDREGAARIDDRLGPPPLRRQLGERGGDVDAGERARRCGDRPGMGEDDRAQILEVRRLGRERVVARLRDPRRQSLELGRAEADDAGERLAVDEAGVGEQGVGDARRDLDVIAENVVVADLEGRDPGLGAQPRLERRDQPPPVVGGGAQLVERGVVALGDEPAASDVERRLGHQRRAQRLDRAAMRADAPKRRGQQRWRRQPLRPRQRILQGQRQRERVAYRGKVARTTAPEREPRQRALEVGPRLQRLARPLADDGGIDEPRDEVEPRADRADVGQRCSEIVGERPRAAARDGQVDAREQAPGAASARAAAEFEAGAGRRVDRHDARGGARGGWRQQGQRPRAGGGKIGEQPAGGSDLGAAEAAEPVERRDAELAAQPRHRPARVELAGRAKCRRSRPALGRDRFGGREPRELGVEPGQVGRQRPEHARRYVGPRHSDRVPDACDRRQPVRYPRVEQRVFGQRAGRHHPDDRAGDDALAPALLGVGRAFNLLGDRDTVPAADQPLEVDLGRMDRHAAHRDVRAEMLAAPGQRDVERRRGLGRVVEEQFVEVAHAEEQQAPRRLRLDAQILRHHGRGFGHRATVTRADRGGEEGVVPCSVPTRPYRVAAMRRMAR